jgi:glycosyltransferase involved in cell wall biosynthesis
MTPALRSLYVCYLSLRDPLVQTQVVAYLEGLARRGHEIHLLTFEPKLESAERESFRRDLEGRGIAWHSLRYHKRPSLPATVFDALLGALVSVRLIRRHRLDAIHARSHVPAASALIVRRLTGCRLIFDIRGLMAEEFADAGRWRRGGLAYRLTNRIQDMAIRRADGIVVLTDRVRLHLFGADPDKPTYVIPCCADLDLFANCGGGADAALELGAEGRPIMVYVGKLAPRYMEREMVAFFAAARRLEPSLLFLVLTQSPPDTLLSELTRAGVGDSDYRVTQADPSMLGAYLGAATFGIYLYRPTFSEIAASPTKAGEYLAAGLPLVSGPDVGDMDALLRDREVGVIVDEFSERTYDSAARRILELAAAPECAERCRAVAREAFSLEEVGIPRYDRLYRELAQAP